MLWMWLLLGLGVEAETTDTLTVETVVNKANLAAYYAGQDGRVEARMLIQDAKGNKQMRQFVMLRRNVAVGGDQQFLVVFSRPTDVKNTVFLVHKNVSGADDRWLFLPALDLEKRIAASDKRTSFVGSHYYYEDVSGRLPTLDSHKLVDVQADRVTLKSTPLAPDLVAFDHYVTVIDRTTWLPMKTTYYDRNNQAIRQMEVLEVEQVEGKPTVMKATMSDLLQGGSTLLQFRKPDYDLGLSDTDFQTRSLRHPPRQWLNP